MVDYNILSDAEPASQAIDLAIDLLPPAEGEELYHTGNTGVISFKNSVSPTDEDLSFSTTESVFRMNRPIPDGLLQQFNSSGLVAGSISMTGGNSVSFNTSSDNRLKNNTGKPTDEQVNEKFDCIYNTFTTFNFKSEPDRTVWGWLAHDVIDCGLDFATEGDGSRELQIGEVYQESVHNDAGVELTQEKRVTPAGVDQSKVVPYLVAKIEQLDRRIKQLEGEL